MSLKKHIWTVVLVLVIASLAAVAGAQNLTDIGAAIPTPGPNDISQLSTNGNKKAPDSLNFYSNNGNPPGQTFTNGSNSTNLVALGKR
ncbi:MAG TPA: hypothetical protein VFC17_01230 [Candidatus Limnocylindrales bacterium]|nr:hypothetical protein [Candidatus Limnocylindrales bacterium]